MASQVQICNMALGHLGVSKTIAALNESSQEARSCNLFYDQVVEECLRDFAWPFATRVEALALVETDPNTDWTRSYRYPSDALAFRRILNGVSRLEATGAYSAPVDPPWRSFGPYVAGTRIPFRIGSDDLGRLIYTDYDSLYGEFTFRETDPTRYPPDFAQAVSFLLAFYIAPSVTSGDQFKLGNRAAQAYYARMAQAQANAANEEAPDQPLDSSFITSRD